MNEKERRQKRFRMKKVRFPILKQTPAVIQILQRPLIWILVRSEETPAETGSVRGIRSVRFLVSHLLNFKRHQGPCGWSQSIVSMATCSTSCGFTPRTWWHWPCWQQKTERGQRATRTWRCKRPGCAGLRVSAFLWFEKFDHSRNFLEMLKKT